MTSREAKRRPTNKRQRKHARKAVSLPVTITEEDNRSAGEILFDTLDLSVSGAFLVSSLLFEVNETLMLQFQLTDKVLVRTQCRVIRISHDSPTGMGIEFVEMTKANRDAILDFLKKQS